jgi:hypothetical protein
VSVRVIHISHFGRSHLRVRIKECRFEQRAVPK